MKKLFKNKKVENVFVWITAIGIIFGIPYLIIGILEAGIAFKPLGYLITGIIYFVFGGAILAGVIDMSNGLITHLTSIYDIEGRAGLDKKLLKYFKTIVWTTLLVTWLFGLAPTDLQPFVATAVGGGFVWYYVLPAIRDLWKGFRKDRKK